MTNAASKARRKRRFAHLLPRVNDHAIPDGRDYADTGCHVHPACLSCPLPACIYDAPQERRANPHTLRDLNIRALRGILSVRQLAAIYGVTPRSVYRITLQPGG